MWQDYLVTINNLFCIYSLIMHFLQYQHNKLTLF